MAFNPQSEPELYELKPAPGFPGVHTSPILQRHFLGLVPSHNLLYCLSCPNGRPLKVSSAAGHLKKVHDLHVSKLPSMIEKLATHYNAYHGLLSDVRTPQLVVHPFPFLPLVQGHRCLLCLQACSSWIGVDDTTRINHFRDKHFDHRSKRASYEKHCVAQSFVVPYTGNKLFEVNRDIPPTNPTDEEDLYEIHNSTPEQLVRSFIDDYAPARLQRPTEIKLKDVNPFLVHTGWAKHVQPLDPSFLVSLTDAPAKDTPLRRLYEAAIRVFKSEQQRYPEVVPMWLSALMHDGSGAPTRPFRALQSDAAVLEYAKTLALWSCFIIRLYNLHRSEDARYSVHFTREQLATAKQALLYSEDAPSSATPARVIADLARSFWRLDHPEYFAHLAISQFNDPTVRFGALLNLREDGSFLDPRNSTHNLVQIKYIIRTGLYLWSRLEAEEKGASIVGTLDRICGSLVRTAMTPFACIADATSTGTTYAASSVRLPNVMWTSSTDLTVEGQLISWPQLRQELNDLILDVRRHIFEKVLLGFSLEDLGYDVTESTPILDDPSRLDQGYSFLEDLRGPFIHLKTRLGSKILSDRRGDHLHLGRDQGGKIAWVDEAAHAWMKDCEWAVERLALLMHVSGGQPGRGVEFCSVQVKNPLHRFRGIYILGPGRVVVVLSYNKTTANTGRDWIVAHAVPWCIGELFVIMHGLVNPLVGVLVKRTYGEAKRQVQELSAFASFGKELSSERLARIIETWFHSRLRVDVRIRRLRHLMIAVQHHLMPEACSPFKKSLLILDAQAGHSSETAQAHYAIDASETHRLATNTVAREIAASARWWSILIDPKSLTPVEVSEAKQAAVTIAREEVLPLPPAPSIDANTLREALAAVLPDMASTLLQQFAERFPALLSGPNPHGNHSTPGAKFLPAPPQIVEPSHLDVLRRFRNDLRSTFRSKGQAQAFVHALNRTASLLCVLATGGGKSVMFASMPVAEEGITVVIFPLRAVLADQLEASRRATHLAPFQSWEYGQHFEDGVVALSVETAATPAFATWIAGINTQKRLNRIVFDEAHLLVTEQSYRIAMLNLYTLIEQGVPLVCLTATLPPAMLPDLQQVLGFPTFYVVRESTIRRNIILHTPLFANRAQALAALVRHVARYCLELKPREGIMVQCRYRAETEDIAKAICRATSVATDYYHGGIDQSEKDQVVFRWISGERPIIVCTSGLGSGVNHPACRAVLHFGAPYGMTDYAQEVGRAGRDGLPAVAILFAWQPLPPVEQPDVKGYSHLHDTISTGDCLQYRLTRYLDGQDLAESCSSSGCLPCGPCKVGSAKVARRGAPAVRNGPTGPALEVVVHHEQDWIESHLPTHEPPNGDMGVSTLSHPAYTHLEPRRPRVLVPATPSPAHVPHPPSSPPLRGGTPGRPLTGPSISATDDIESAGDGEGEGWQIPRGPAADVGTQVRADAESSKNRRREVLELPQGPDEQQEARHNPFSLPSLLRIKSQLSHCCPFCVIYRRPIRDHPLQECPHNPGIKGTLEGFEIKDKGFMQYKRNSNLPGTNLLCFFCWWPRNHDHPSGPLPHSCSLPDNIPQLCWLVFRDNELRKEIQTMLDIAPDHLSSLAAYWKWIATPLRKFKFQGQNTAFLNAHVVYLYFFGPRRYNAARAGK